LAALLEHARRQSAQRRACVP